ncbi:MAG: hypothetical protein R3D66_04450 [Alphaproteobacteria bacterium]
MQLRAGEIQQTVRAAREQVEALSDALSLQSSDTHLATDQILLRLESVRAALNDQFDELSSSVGEAVARIEGAGSALEGRSQVLKNISGDSIRQLESIGSAVQAQADSAEERLSATAACLKLLVVDIEKETGRFLDATDVQISGLKKAGESLSIRAREISEQMKAALRTSVSYGKELKAQAASVAEASVLSTEQLGKSVSILTDKLRTIDTATMQVTGQIEKAGDKLTDESERLLCVSSAALEGAKEAASTFTKQSEALFKASQDAAEFAGEIGRKTTRMQRESFLDSSKFIIESLHSLSVDLSRGMEGHIPEKTWKAFQKGDVSAFTRRLNEMQENWPLEKAQAKFAQDMEFRTYVRRFIRQFEDMYDQARRGDHDALLCTTIGSSEVARLYERLCSVAGAESKLSLRGA